MKVLRLFAVALACAACTDPTPPAATAAAPVLEPCTLIKNVRIFDGTRVVERGAVVVRDRVVADVGPGITASCRDVVDGTARTILPGLIDSHVHVWDEAQLQAGMRFGVTTMLDMMTDWHAAAKLKASAATRPELSDLRSAGNPVTARGGHGTEYGLSLATLESAKDADAFVAARVKEGSDYVKIIYTPDLPMFRSIDRDVLRASVAAAHHNHRLAVVHIDTEKEATEALEAGADGLAHLFYDRSADAAFVTLAHERHAFVVPTLSVLTTLTGTPHGAVLAKDLASRLSPREVAALGKTYPVKVAVDEAGIVRSVRALHAAGVPLLAGTDASNPGTSWGVSLHGELELLVASGLAPGDALVAATSAPARAFGLDDRGRIARGARADLLLVDGDPTRDIRATRRTVAVWKAGTRLADRFLAAPAEAPDAPSVEAPLAKPAPGPISDFEDEAMSSRFGVGWTSTTDAIIGGASVVSLDRASHGKGFDLAVKGTVAPGTSAWSGVMFNPGAKLWTPVDLSAGTALVFSARGDGRRYGVLLFTKRGGRIGARQSFVADEAWKEHRLALSDFAGADARDVIGIAFVAGPEAGAYRFELDDVQLR